MAETAPLNESAERVRVYKIVIRALNQKIGMVKKQRTRLELRRTIEWLANDPAFVREEPAPKPVADSRAWVCTCSSSDAPGQECPVHGEAP